MPVAMIYREELKEYDFGPGHPFRGDRYEIFPRFLKQNLSEDNYYRIVKSEPVGEEDLLRICTKDYIDFSREFYRAANMGQSYDGRFHQYHSSDNMPQGRPGKLEEAARLLVGQAKLAADLVMTGQYLKAISIGGGVHHAKRSYGEGFCIYNDVAFTALYLIEKYGLERVLILDTDAHAGNGTSDYFYSDPRVLLIDLHQDPLTLYPGTGFARDTGIGKGAGYTMNIPLPPGAAYDSYKYVFEKLVEPVVAEFKPQITIRNGGSDPHFDDGLTDLGLTVKGFRLIGEKMRQLSEVCGGKHIDLIASGYNEKVLPYCWMALLSGLSEFPVYPEDPAPIPSSYQQDGSLDATKRVVAQVKGYHKEYWRSLPGV